MGSKVPDIVTPDTRKEYSNGNFTCMLKPLLAKDTDHFLNLMALQDKWGQISTDKKKSVEKFKNFTKEDIERLINIVTASIAEWNFDKEISVANVGELLNPMQLLGVFGEVMSLNFRE